MSSGGNHSHPRCLLIKDETEMLSKCRFALAVDTNQICGLKSFHFSGMGKNLVVSVVVVLWQVLVFAVRGILGWEFGVLVRAVRSCDELV